jgi:hypothetical protein
MFITPFPRLFSDYLYTTGGTVRPIRKYRVSMRTAIGQA